jgi:glycosyltransferase involved in cell wall biosynthesis
MNVVYPRLQTLGQLSIEAHREGDLTTCIVSYRHIRKTWLLPYGLAALRGVRALGLRPHCVHAHDLYPAGLVALALGMWLRAPVVITEHWGRLLERVRDSSTMALILPLVLRKATRVVAVSNALSEEMISLEPRCRPVVVPNTVLPDFFGPTLSHPADTTLLRVLFVGSLHDDRKGLPDLLSALAICRRRYPRFEAHLSIIGDGATRSRAEAFARELGLAGLCTFLGNRSRPEVVEAMANCHVLAVPSRYETFGVVYAEAMACGKPVIACSGTAAAEVVPPWAGRFAPPGDREGLTAALEYVARNRTAFDPQRIRAHAEARFGPRAFLEAMARVYDPLLSPAPA